MRTTGTETSTGGDSLHDVLEQAPRTAAIAVRLDSSGTPTGILVDGLIQLQASNSRFLIAGQDASDAGHFAVKDGRYWVSLLAEDQSDLIDLFACDQDSNARSVEWRNDEGLPAVPRGALGWIECTIDKVVHSNGSFVGFASATSARLERDARAMIRYQGGFGGFLPTAMAAAGRPYMQEAHRIARLAQEPIELLAREMGAECSVVGYADGEEVVLAVSNHSAVVRGSSIGETFPAVPPIGTLFVDSPATDLTKSKWLERLRDLSPEEVKERSALAEAQLARVAARGWSIMVGGPYSPQDLETLTEATREASAEERASALTRFVHTMAGSHEPDEILDDEFYEVHVLSMPVRVAGATTVALRLRALPPSASGAEVRLWLSLLQQTVADVEAGL